MSFETNQCVVIDLRMYMCVSAGRSSLSTMWAASVGARKFCETDDTSRFDVTQRSIHCFHDSKNATKSPMFAYQCRSRERQRIKDEFYKNKKLTCKNTDDSKLMRGDE